jgi:hypothetical protein
MTPKERMKDSHVIEFNRDSEVQMEFNTKVTAMATQITNTILTPNEARRLLNLPSAGPDGDRFYRQANLMVVGEDEQVTTEPNSNQRDTSDEDGEDTDESSPAENLLRAMITSSVTSAVKLEQSKVVQRAGSQPARFMAEVDAFYQTWTANTVAGLEHSDARTAIISHAEESKRLLSDVHSVSTTLSLKSNVSDVVASWDSRAETLISSLMKAVR